MQLFITEYKKKDTSVVITDSDLLSQLRKVLRANIGDSIRIQSPHNEPDKMRYEVRIDKRDTTTITWTVIFEQSQRSDNEQKSMIIAMPNKRDKVELIVQKLTECGLDQIVFRPSERSVIKERNPKKAERLQKIIKEAVEQSRGRSIPTLEFTSDITKYIQNTQLIVFDKIGAGSKEQGAINQEKSKVEGLKTKVWLVGPEGGLTQKDYQMLAWTYYTIYGLGDTVLRTETAAIIGGRILKNNFKC